MISNPPARLLTLLFFGLLLHLPQRAGAEVLEWEKVPWGYVATKTVTGPACVQWDEFQERAYPLGVSVDGHSTRTSRRLFYSGPYCHRAALLVNLPAGEHTLVWGDYNNPNWPPSIEISVSPCSAPSVDAPYDLLGLPAESNPSSGGSPLTRGRVLTENGKGFISVVTPLDVESSDAWVEWDVTGPALVSLPVYGLASVRCCPHFYLPGILCGGHWIHRPRDDDSSGVAILNMLRWRVPAGRHRQRITFPLIPSIEPHPLAPAIGAPEITPVTDQSAEISAAVEMPEQPWWPSEGAAEIKTKDAPAVGGSVATLAAQPLNAGVGMGTLLRGPAMLTWTSGFSAGVTWYYNPVSVLWEQLPLTAQPLPALVPAVSGEWQWQRSRLRLPAGTSMVSWHSTVDAGIDDVRLEPLPAVPLLTALPWARAAAGEWMAWERAGRRMLGPREALAAGGESAVHFEVEGPLLLAGEAPEAWAPDCAFELRLDHAPALRLEAAAFRSWKWPVPAGRHTVSFVASRPALSEGTLAALELPAPTGSPLSQTYDLSGWAGVSLRSHAAQPWYFTTSDGITATMQPVPGAGPETWAELEMDGPRWISFVWNKTATPVILVDGLRLPDSALDVATRNLVEVPGGLFVPAGCHRVRWEGTGPVTLGMRSNSPGSALPGDPATVGLHGSFAFHLKAPDGWAADGAEHTEGSASWRASPSQSLWLPVRGPAVVRYATRSTGSGVTSLGIRTLLDYRSAGIAPRSAVWSERTVTIPAGWHTLQWMNIGASDLLTWLDDVRIEPADAFGQWCQSRGLPVMEWTAEADSDRDGTPNAIEFATGTDPAVPTLSPLRAESTGDGKPVILFPVPNVPATAAVLSLEVSADLTSWTLAAAAGLVISSDGSSQRTVLTPAWRFARLRGVIP